MSSCATGKTMRIPLLRDYHSHPYLYAALGNCLDISAVTDGYAALSLIRERFTREDFVVVTGWFNSCFSFDDEELDMLPPLVVFNVSLHSMLINAAAREALAGAFPQVVQNYRSAGWLERNATLALNFLVNVKPCGVEGLGSFFASLARLGVWYAEEMSLQGDAEVALFGKASLMERTRFWTSLETFGAMGVEAVKHVHGIKLFADGAVGARTAMLRTPYLSGEEGVLVWNDNELRNLIESVSRTGKSLSVHAIGDTAIDRTLAVLEQARGCRGAFPEIRMEHCQFISLQSALKAQSLGVKLCLQPNFSLDSTHYTDRLPEPYCRANNPLRMLIDDAGFIAGKDLLFGSDGMPHGIRTALKSALFPPFDSQRLTLDEFIAGYCMPDFCNGHIDLSIDYGEKKVEAEVVLRDEAPRRPSP